MTKAPFKYVVLLAILTLLPRFALGQGLGAASVAGTVKDASGAVLPGVTVEAASPVLIEKVRTTVTDSEGRYQLAELRAGTYTLTFTLAGFTTYKREGLQLTPNFAATSHIAVWMSRRPPADSFTFGSPMYGEAPHLR